MTDLTGKTFPANTIKGLDSIGGTLRFSEKGIIFKPYRKNIQKSAEVILFSDINSVDATNNFGVIPYGILIRTKMKEYSFIVTNRDEIIEFIKSKMIFQINDSKPPETLGETSDRFCEKCGKPLNETDYCCSYCGNPVKENAVNHNQESLKSAATESGSVLKKKIKSEGSSSYEKLNRYFDKNEAIERWVNVIKNIKGKDYENPGLNESHFSRPVYFYSKQELINELETIRNHCLRKESEYRERDKYLMDLASLKDVNGTAWFFSGVALSIVIYYLFIIMNMDIGVAGFIILSVIFDIVFPMAGYRKQNINKMLKSRKLRTEIDALNDDLKIHFKNIGKCIISFEYSNPEVIEEIIHLISSGRAENVKEAVNCILDDRNKQDKLKFQKETAKNFKDTAGSRNLDAQLLMGSYFNARKK